MYTIYTISNYAQSNLTWFNNNFVIKLDNPSKLFSPINWILWQLNDYFLPVLQPTVFWNVFQIRKMQFLCINLLFSESLIFPRINNSWNQLYFVMTRHKCQDIKKQCRKESVINQSGQRHVRNSHNWKFLVNKIHLIIWFKMV